MQYNIVIYRKNMPDEWNQDSGIPSAQAALVFTNEKGRNLDADEAPAPTISCKKIKGLRPKTIKRQGSLSDLTLQMIQEIIE
jgi:hypothetical protein